LTKRASLPFISVGAALGAAAVLAGCGGGRPPNVVLVVVDSLRADALGPHEGQPSVSPQMDRLAAESLRFERAVAPASWNLPSISSLVTSTYPWTHGQGAPGSGEAEVTTLAEAFGRGGYRTAAFTEVAWPLLQRGFETFANTAGEHVFGDPEKNSAERTFSLALDWARRDDPRPFFLLVHTYEVQSYFLGKPADRAFAARERPDYQGPFRDWAIRDFSRPAGEQVTDALLRAGPEDLAWVKSLYRGAVSEVDGSLGRFAAGLRDAGLDGRTVLTVTSSNGEGFRPDLARVHHGGRLHDDVLHVPLFIRWPGHVRPGDVSALVGTLDVAPTLLRLAGLPPEARFAGHPLVEAETGLAASLRGPRFRAGKRPDEPVVAEEGAFRVSASGHREAATAPQFALYSDRVTLIDAGDHVELYDLKADPEQEKNLAEARPEVAKALKEQLGRLVARAKRATAGPNAEQLEQLRSLGYVQ
jgi:arylsulfatase A-like enzyme